MTEVSLVSLPVELIASILSELDITALRNASEVCSHLRAVASDPLLNPWRGAILRALSHHTPTALKNISVLSTVPRHNWLEILCYASPDFLLFEATLPNLSDDHFKLAFRRRFLPSWAKIRKNGSWKEAFMKMLFYVYHRLTTNCTTSEAWTNFIIVNRTGVANSTTTLSRTFDPVTHFNILKDNANLSHLDTSVRLIVRLADVRIIMFGILHRNTSLFKNPNAVMLLHPPEVSPPSPPTSTIELPEDLGSQTGSDSETDESEELQVDISAPSPLLELARRARSSSHPVPSSSPQSSLPFWRTRSRDSGTPSRSGTAGATGASPSGSNGLLPTFMTRLFSSPASMSTSSQAPFATSTASTSVQGSPPVASVDENILNSVAGPVTPISPETPSAQIHGRNPPISNGGTGPHRGAKHDIPQHRLTRHRSTVVRDPVPLSILQYPTPHRLHANYPNFTPGGDDWRWYRTPFDRQWRHNRNTHIPTTPNALQLTVDDENKTWVGPILIVAQLYPTFNRRIPSGRPHPGIDVDGVANHHENEDHIHDNVDEVLDDPAAFEERALRGQLGQGRWASFGWPDLWAIAPWLDDPERGIAKRVDGVGLGIE